MPGKSLVFAAMELLMFILVRHMPQLSSKVSDSPSHIVAKNQQLSEESARLVASTVSILADLPSLCSPAGNVFRISVSAKRFTKALCPLPVLFHIWIPNSFFKFISQFIYATL